MKLDTDLMGWFARPDAPSRRQPQRETKGLERLRRRIAPARRTAKPAISRRARIEAGISSAFVSGLDPDRKPRIISTRRVIGTSVFDAEGERAGRITDLSIDKETGRIVYALIGLEGGLGFLKRLYPAPWRLLRYDARLGGYVVPADKADVANGPALTPEQLQALGAGDDAWWERLAIYNSPYLTLPFG